MDMTDKAWIGLDVSKDTLDAYLIRQQETTAYGKFTNTKKGYAQLFKWVKRLAPDAASHFCLEATGSYSLGPAEFLAEAGMAVSVINPCVAKHAAIAQGSINKTDKTSAKSLAEYCRNQAPSLWRPSLPEVRTLTALVRHRDNLQQQLLQQTNRRQEPHLVADVAQSLDKMIGYLREEIRLVERRIDEHVKKHPGLKADRDLLVSIPGIAEDTAHHILAELPDVTQFASAKQAAAYAGLNPREFRSGTSVHRKTCISKRGNAHLRRALYMPSLTALRCNSCVMALTQRLQARRHTEQADVGAAMRKLLMLAFGVLRTRQPFQEDYALTRQSVH